MKSLHIKMCGMQYKLHLVEIFMLEKEEKLKTTDENASLKILKKNHRLHRNKVKGRNKYI